MSAINAKHRFLPRMFAVLGVSVAIATACTDGASAGPPTVVELYKSQG